jgi:hypothetical protein
MIYDDWKFQQPDDDYYAEQEEEINEPINYIKMETLKYIIENNINIANNIIKEYPNVDYVPFKINNCSYNELKGIATEYQREISIKNGYGTMSLYTGKAYFAFETKLLIVSEPIIVEG